MSYLCKLFNFRRKWMKYKNIIKLRLPEIQLLVVVPTQSKFSIVKDHDESTILLFETLFCTWECFSMGRELSTRVMLGQTLVLMQMTFLNNVRKIGRLVLSRTSYWNLTTTRKCQNSWVKLTSQPTDLTLLLFVVEVGYCSEIDIFPDPTFSNYYYTVSLNADLQFLHLTTSSQYHNRKFITGY
jgi:hypothetical protein